MRLRTGDKVEVISGDDRGTRAEVIRVLPKENRIVVQGVNLRKKHQRQQQTAGRRALGSGILEFEAPINASNVLLVCPNCDEAVRVGTQQSAEAGRTVRVCRNCDTVIDK